MWADSARHEVFSWTVASVHHEAQTLLTIYLAA